MGTLWRAHITPVLSQLHWLQIGDRIRFKVLVLTFKALNGLGPAYLRERLFRYIPQRALWSSDHNLLSAPGPKEERLASTRTFLVLAPAWWNTLPEDIRALRDLSQFHRACKAGLFRQARGCGPDKTPNHSGQTVEASRGGFFPGLP